MKRDMDLVRKILMVIEDCPSGQAPAALEVRGRSDDEIGYHVLIMIEGGLVEGMSMGATETAPTGIASRLTWGGHEFLDAAREPERWEKARRIIDKVGGVTLQVCLSILTKLMEEALE